MAELILFGLGSKGVNVDQDSLHMENNALRKAQNAHPNPLGAASGISNRPGLIKFSAVGAGAILGGIGVPLTNKATGTSFFLLGRDTSPSGS